MIALSASSEARLEVAYIKAVSRPGSPRGTSCRWREFLNTTSTFFLIFARVTGSRFCSKRPFTTTDGARLAPILVFPSKEDLREYALPGRPYWDGLFAELDRRGITRKTTGTAEEQAREAAQKEATAKQKEEEKKRLAEQRRRDSALLNTYANDSEIDRRRDRELQEVDRLIGQLEALRKSTVARRTDAEKRLAAAEKARRPTDSIKDEVESAESDMDRIEKNIAAKNKEKEEIRMEIVNEWIVVEDFLEQHGLSSQVDIETIPEGMKITLSDSLTFNSGSSEILPMAQLVLEKIAEMFDEEVESTEVQGHTDNVPLSAGSYYRSNWHLGAARAVSVVEFIRARSELPPQNYKASSFGEYRPIATNETPAGRRQNRRVEIYVRYKSLIQQQEIPVPLNSFLPANQRTLEEE